MQLLKQHIISLLVVTLGALSLTACHGPAQPAHGETVYVPPTPDYSDNLMWVTYLNGSTPNSSCDINLRNSDIANGDTDNLPSADVFYIPSTWEYDWYTADNVVCHYADPSNPTHRADMKIEMDGVAEYMADGNNFYSPFYRHITLDSWATLNEDTINRRYHDVAFVDVRNAFDHYLTHHNAGRPFILAGFSQGGKSVVELLKILDPETRRRMIAAYVMGYKVTPEDVASHPYITAAGDSADTGVVVCYNSVSDIKYVKPVVAAPNVMAINPVNWRIDDKPAILNDTITVTLNPDAKVLVVEGFDGSYLPNILDILNVGDYHGAEPWLYSECLRSNIQQRKRAFFKKKQQRTDKKL
ncbi:MAG: DUF3089 domain-containing protein [Muribaculaceae bacterium]|nr:DUF3089 domain-containing protein [Muribaculaceae bacterium]